MEFEDIIVGDVLALHCQHITPPKVKYLIIAATEPDPIFLYINSNLTVYADTNPSLQECHIKIFEIDHSFLKRDSWVNCCKPCHEFTVEDIERDLKYGGRHLGSLSETAVSSVIEGIKNSRTVKKKIKTLILDSLEIIR